MNAVTRVATSQAYGGRRAVSAILPVVPGLWTVVWMAVILISALGVVYTKDLYRRTFIDYQDLQQARDGLQTEWGKLLLEESAWSTQARVQRLSEQALGMYRPAEQDVVVVTDAT